MSKYIRVSCLGPYPVEMSTNINIDQTVNEMIAHWGKQLEQVLCDKPDIVVLPEACDRPAGFPYDLRKEYYLKRGDTILDYFSSIAIKNNCYIAYSAAREVAGGSFRNSTRIIGRDGKVKGTYNKNHLIIEETTKGGILCGKEAEVIHCDFGKVACVICFDLNFDELRLKYASQKPELIIFSSMYHGGLMQSYWAYSCRSYFAGAVARHNCTIISPVGNVIAASTNYYNYVTADINLDYEVVHLDYNRDRISLMKSKYGDKVKLYDPGYLGSVLITSETREFSARQVTEEFGIELLDDYMNRARKHRENNTEL